MLTQEKKYLTIRKLAVSIIVFFVLLGGFIYQDINPLNLWLKQANTNILASAKPELFEIKLNLNDLGLKMLAFEDLSNIYPTQKCYLNATFTNEELANSNSSDDQDFDNDGLNNSKEMIYNANPKQKQTQPNLDDNIQYIDSKSPYNSRQINKTKNFYISTQIAGEQGEKIESDLNRLCEQGYWFFDIYNNERLYQPTELKINENPVKTTFDYFSNKEIELIKNRELDIFLKIGTKNPTIYKQEIDQLNQKLSEINEFVIEPKNSNKFLSLYDFYNKMLEIYKTESLPTQIDKYKEVLYIIKNLN